MRRYLRVLLLLVLMIILTTCCPSPTPSNSNANSGGAVLTNVDATGAYRSSIAIEVPPFHGLEPAMSLVYNSNGGNDWLGVGWYLAGYSTIRRVSRGEGAPRYDSRDIFLLNGMELIPCTPAMESPSCKYPASPSYQAYTMKIESFQRIAFDPNRTASGTWYVWTKTGTKITYESRSYFGTHGHGTHAWDVFEVEDTLGNKIIYGRWSDGHASGLGETYLDQIAYNGNRIKFYYELRPDVVTYAVGHDLVHVRYRLKTIDVQVGKDHARAYGLAYEKGKHTGRSLLNEVRQYGTDAQISQTGEITNAQSVPSILLATFETSPVLAEEWGATQVENPTWTLPRDGGVLPAVLNGTALPISHPFLRFTASNLGDVDGNGQTDWIQAAPDLVIDPMARHREILVTTALAGKSTPAYTQYKLSWIYPGLVKNTMAADVNGDGRVDLVFVIRGDKIQGEIPNSGDGQYLSLAVALSRGDGTFLWALPTVQTTSWETRELNYNRVSHCQSGDVDGNGMDDIICSFTKTDGSHHIGTAISQGSGKFEIAEKPAPFASQGETRLMAVGDSNGDGLSDAIFLDFPRCPWGQPTCTVNYELVTALSAGNGDYQFERHSTNWEYRIFSNFFAADINGDGKSDYVVLKAVGDPNDEGAIQTAITMPDGNYLLNAQTVPPVLRNIEHSFSVGDVNGDGKIDLLVVSRQPPGAPGCSTSIPGVHVNLHRVLSRGNGYFDLPVSWTDCWKSRELDIAWENIKFTPVEPQAADVNGDGTADFLIADAQEGRNFTTLREDLSPHPTGDTFNWFPAEVNGDGRSDWVYIRYTPTGPLISTLLHGKAVAQSPFPGTESLSALRNWRVMDINADGRDDLVCLYSRSPAEGIRVTSWISNGDGSWRIAPSQYVFNGRPRSNSLNWRVADINGDGKLDLVHINQAEGRLSLLSLISKGDGTWNYIDSITSWYASDTLNWKLGDINGDGKSDLIYLQYLKPGVRIYTLLSQGDGTWTVARSTPSEAWNTSESGSTLFNTLYWIVMDVNADGMSDLVHLSPSNRKPGQKISLRIHALISNGDGNWTPQDRQAIGTFTGDMINWRSANVNSDGRGDLVHTYVQIPSVTVTTLSQSINGDWFLFSHYIVSTAARDTYGVFFRLADVDGNGQDDLTRFDLLSSGMRVFSLQSNYPPDLIRKSTSGFGSTIQIKYEPWSKSVLIDTSHGCHLPVGVGFYTVTEISVTDGRQATTGKETYGYNCAHWSYKKREFLGWEEITSGSKASIHRPASTTLNRYRIIDECLAQPIYTQVHDSTGKPFIKTIVSYSEPGSKPPYRCLVNYYNRIELNQTDTGQNAYTYYHYDEFGNIDRYQELGNPLITSDDHVTERTYHSVTGPYIVGLPATEGVRAGSDSSGKPERGTFFCYDGDTNFSCGKPPTKGLLTRLTELNMKGLADLAETDFFYDAYGNVAGVRDPNRHGHSIFYDKIYHIYPVVVCNALNQCEKVEWDYTLGQTTAVMDTNKQVTQFMHDVFGRLIETQFPNGGKLQRAYLDWGDPTKQHVREWLDDGTEDGLWTETYLDGVGRIYRMVREGDLPGKTYIRDAIYADSTDQVYKQTHWFRLGDKPVYELFEYDAIGRLVRLTHPDGEFQHFSYGNDANLAWVAAYDELGNEKITFHDSHGRLNQVRERNRGSQYQTTYAYNSLGQIREIIDAAANKITYTYDLRGRRTAMSDPNLGNRNYDYDLVGNLLAQTDTQGLTVRFSYDELNRVISKTYPDGRTITWKYDEPGHGASGGRLTSIVDSAESRCSHSISQEFYYDGMGQVLLQKRCIEGVSVHFQFSYDKLRRLETITYPDGEMVTYGYNDAGRPKSLSGYVQSMSYDAAGRLTGVEYANRTGTVLSYDPKRQWLDEMSVSIDSNKLYQAAYKYFQNGLLRKTSSTTNKMNLDFQYDGINRLTNVSGDFNQALDYDPVGNITFNSEVGTYSYLTNTKCGLRAQNPCPYAVKQTLSLDTTHMQQFSYDDNGNMILAARIDNGVRKERSIEWNADNKPILIQSYDGIWSNMRYDTSGQRVYRERNGQVTHYYGGYMDFAYPISGGTIQKTQYYYAGPLLVAHKDAIGTFWHHQDHLGSTRLLTDKSGTVVAKYDYKPFGETVSSLSNIVTDIRFIGHRTDTENELIYMNARYYDPQIARFMSADSIIPKVGNPRTLNRFSYAFNNPNVYIDPDGRQPQDTRSIWERFFDWISDYEPPDTSMKPVDPIYFRQPQPEPSLFIQEYVDNYPMTEFDRQWNEIKLSTFAIWTMLSTYYEIADKVTLPAQILYVFPAIRSKATGLMFEELGSGSLLDKGFKLETSVTRALRYRAEDIHFALPQKAMDRRTTAVFRAFNPKTSSFVDVVAAGAKHDLSPVQSMALQSGEVIAKYPGLDAEMKALHYIDQKGWLPYAGGISRNICPVCRYTMEMPEVWGGATFVNEREVLWLHTTSP